MHVVVAGCGWLGTAIGVELRRQGHRVTAIRRDPQKAAELAALGLEPLVLDLADPKAYQQFPKDVQGIVCCQAARADSADGYRGAYLDANQTLLRAAAARSVQALVYTGSTGVFGYRDGREVAEDAAVAPTSRTAELLVEAEQLLVEAGQRGLPTRVVRLSGLYGPGRWGALTRVRSGALALGPGDDAYMNFCHQEDAVAAVIAALQGGRDGVVYHASDAAPPRRRDVVQWLAAQMGVDPVVSTAMAAPDAPNRRIQAEWSRQQLGLTLVHPDYRSGFAQALPGVGG